MGPTDNSEGYERDVELQRQIDALTFTTDHLGVTVQVATDKVGKNEEKLERLMDQVARMDGTILRMRADLPTKEDLDVALNTTLNKHIAKGFWTVVVLSIGAVVTWLASNVRIG